MSNPKLVTDGTKYAVREGNWFTGYKFYSIDQYYWYWCSPEYVNKYCWGTKEQAIRVLEKVKNYDAPKPISNKIPKNWVVK